LRAKTCCAILADCAPTLDIVYGRYRDEERVWLLVIHLPSIGQIGFHALFRYCGTDLPAEFKPCVPHEQKARATVLRHNFERIGRRQTMPKKTAIGIGDSDPDDDDDSLERICLELAAEEEKEDSLDKLLEKWEDDEDDYDALR
jgi:hypothetical protein